MSLHPAGRVGVWAYKRGEPQGRWERPDDRPTLLVVGPCSYAEVGETVQALERGGRQKP